jgi:hypothetical protein
VQRWYFQMVAFGRWPAVRCHPKPASSLPDSKSKTVRRYLSLSMTALVFTEGSVTARCAARATSAHVFSIQTTYSRSLTSGQGFPVSHSVAFVVAACSSSAAANMMILFTLVDAENRRSAVVTRCRTVIASKRHSSVFDSGTMMIDGRGGAEIPPLIPEMRRPRPYGDSGLRARLRHRAVRTDVRQHIHNKRSGTRSRTHIPRPGIRLDRRRSGLTVSAAANIETTRVVVDGRQETSDPDDGFLRVGQRITGRSPRSQCGLSA